MNTFTLLFLSIAFGFALGSIAEAQVTLGGPFRVWEGPNGTGKAIDISPKQAVQVRKFKYDPRNRPDGNVHYNDSGLNNATNGFFEGELNGKKVYIPKLTMIEVLTRQNGPTVPAADPKAAVERLADANKAKGKGPNGVPPCELCAHLVGKEQESFADITKSDDELRKYTCLFHKKKNNRKTGVGERNFEIVLPVMKEVEKVTGIPTAYMSCVIQQESQFEIFNGGPNIGLGHFNNATRKTILNYGLADWASRVAANLKRPPVSSSEAAARLAMNDGERLTQDIAITQVTAIALNLRRLLDEFGMKHMAAQQDAVSGDGRALINALLLASAGHNFGEAIIARVPWSAFKSNDTGWTRRVPSGTTLDYLNNMKMCLAKGNFDTRNAGTWPPDYESCGGK